LTALLAPLFYPASLTPSFFLADPAPHDIHPLSLHDALPILTVVGIDHHVDAIRGEHLQRADEGRLRQRVRIPADIERSVDAVLRSEEHTSELQSLTNLVCRLLLETKKNDFIRSLPCFPCLHP